MKKIFFTIAILAIGFFACKKETDTNNTEDVYKTTPYVFNYPSWVDIYLGKMPVNAENLTTVEGVALGRKLFYDVKLSNNQTLSCASCHLQSAGFTDTARFSTGTNGMQGDRNAMQIINLGWSGRMFWDGRSKNLEHQAFGPVVNPVEMANTWPIVVSRLQADAEYPNLFKKAFGTATIDSNLVVKAIAQFERTLTSFNSRFDKFYFEGDTTVFSESEKRGLQVFLHKGDCNHCHNDVLLTDNAFRNNGLTNVFTDKGLGGFTKNPADDGKFKVPTLRNIEFTAPYMHDGRLKTLEDVVFFYSTGVKKNSPNFDENMAKIADGITLTIQEKDDLIAFLKTLSDEQFLNNPNHSKP